jgi:thiol-disulfide isomerase/thioredoxin
MNKSFINAELSVDEFKALVTTLDAGNKNELKAIIFKFGATWCKPCQNIKGHCANCVTAMPDNIQCYDIDIDENIELYTTFKNKRMISGVPTLLGYVKKENRNMNQWYASDISIAGSNTNNINVFFQTIKNY